VTEPENPGDGAREISPMTALNTAALAAGCLYQATGSLDVTLAGTAIAAVLAAWAMWLRRRSTASRGTSSPAVATDCASPAPSVSEPEG